MSSHRNKGVLNDLFYQWLNKKYGNYGDVTATSVARYTSILALYLILARRVKLTLIWKNKFWWNCWWFLWEDHWCSWYSHSW
jgi:hypothetical protein